jgi:hypothetical protein
MAAGGRTLPAVTAGTDDRLARVLTMVQMIGVVVFALGLPSRRASTWTYGSWPATS